MRKTVCLVGRPNTGKSTLFNRLINEKKAIIADTPGVTRDRLYGIVNYKNYSFSLILHSIYSYEHSHKYFLKLYILF